MNKILVLLPTALLILLAIGASNPSYAEQLFVHTTYYLLMVTVLCWGGTYLHAARGVRRDTVATWVRENWPGLVVALSVTLIAGLAVEPALRMLSDEANLVGTSKNLWATKTATFTVSGKYYYDSYWDIDVMVDSRPPLFPFCVSLIHALIGYSYRNVFLFNLTLLPAFVLVSYRLAKSLGGETFGLVASLLVVAHPIALISVRSGGFDFFATFFALLVLKGLFDHCRTPSPETLALLWLNLCLFAEIRYEAALFVPPVVALLLLFRMVTWNALRPYAFIYALTPVFLMPRVWQAVCRGSVPHQDDPGAVVFGFENFVNNSRDYFGTILSPLHTHPPHSAFVITLGIVGCLLWLRWLWRSVRSDGWKALHLRFPIFVVAWMLVQALILLSYVWGRPQHPSSARLFIAIDAFFGFAAAWVLSVALKRCKAFVSILVAVALFVFCLPIAAQHRLQNKLTQTRESNATWRFFEDRHEKRILVVTDRPNHFTIMQYGAMDFETARRDPYLLHAFNRHLFQDVFLVQQISLSNNQPLPGYELWPNRELETMLEFQNDANVLVRISRLARGRVQDIEGSK